MQALLARLALLPLGTYVVAAAWVVALQALALYLLGQPLLCECGHISLWAGEVLGPENSQQITDWYTFSHVIHGFIFYWLATLLFPRLPIGARFLLAVGVEVGWEIFENTPMIIEHYRQQALAQGYVGDSIINSLSDTLAMVGGFFLALRLPTWAVLVLAVGLEGFAIYMIRDGLALNILNFIAPLDSVANWQSGT